MNGWLPVRAGPLGRSMANPVGVGVVRAQGDKVGSGHGAVTFC